MDLSKLELRSARLTLTPFTPSDAAEVFAAITPTLARFMSWEPPASEAELAAILTALGERMKSGEAFDPTVIRLAETGEFLGVGGIYKLDTLEPEPGIWIKEAAHGHGYGREAVKALIDWATATLGAASAVYPADERNAPSRRLAESLGGVDIGRRPLVKPGGAALSLVLYRIPTGQGGKGDDADG